MSYRAILGSIALEPRRWTSIPRYPAMTLHYLLPHIVKAGFSRVEAWQWHVTQPTLDELKIIREQADELAVTFPYIGVYPSFHMEDGPDAEAQHQICMDLIKRAGILGTKGFKIMLGNRRGSEITPEEQERHDRRFSKWYRACADHGIRIYAELHGGTLFDPWEYGKNWLDNHPELDLSICFQPFDFTNLDVTLALADIFAGKIGHIHLQAPGKNGYTLLKDCPLDYTVLLSKILRDNPTATMTLEFVRDCIQSGPFDLSLPLNSARMDAAFVEAVCGGSAG